MRINKLALGLSTSLGFILLVGFQNCGKIQPGLNVQQSDLVQQESTRAIVQDGNGNIDTIITIDQPVVEPATANEPVAVNEPIAANDPAVSNEQVVVAEPIVSNEQVVAAEPVVVNNPQVPAVEPVVQPVQTETFPVVINDQPVVIDPVIENIPADASCVDLAKKYKNEAIDIANIDQQGKLTVLKGRTFIYSSNGNVSLKDVEIGLSCGRTILCGVHIGKIKVQKGRLDMIRSSYDSIEESRGRIDIK